jgi:hypothetical protein
MVGHSNWVFRGQSDARWKLTPAAMRPHAFKHYGIGGVGTRSPTTLTEQLAVQQADSRDIPRREA